MEKMLPILSGSLAKIIRTVAEDTQDPIAMEIIKIHDLIERFNEKIGDLFLTYPDEVMLEMVEPLIKDMIKDEVRMVSARYGDEFEVSFLPFGKQPCYNDNGEWSRTNRQTGKPARILQKLIKREFKTIEWETFNNRLRAEICQCCNFEIVEGEQIRHWYDEANYYKCTGTLGNSCMRYNYCSEYFDIYVDCAKMLISKKNNLLTGRAIVWEMPDGITLLDRIYTCDDYLYNCFINYAKEHKWWIRESNSLLSSGSTQYWFTPDDNYENCVNTAFYLRIPREYSYFPYMDSFRYYDCVNTLCTDSSFGTAELDHTDGSWDEGEVWTCEYCGETYRGYGDETPDELHYSEYDSGYYCDNCCWYSNGMDDYICSSHNCVEVIGYKAEYEYPEDFVESHIYDENGGDFVMIDGQYYTTDSDKVDFDEENDIYFLKNE